jgi:molybdate transport system substrate-binding protein
MAPPPLTGISSMATRALLAELAAAFVRQSGRGVQIESVGGVDAARRVAAGEVFDIVALASDAIAKLVGGGHLVAGSEVGIARSCVAVAVREGAPRPDITSEAALKAAVLGARRIGMSTGPSGVQLQRLFERWGIAQQIAPRLVTAPAGVPVGRLVAAGEVELGFQQLSELVSLPGITLLGALPPAVQITTVFSAALGTHTRDAAGARALLAYLSGPDTAAVKQDHGMESATP